jgi:hypothetical protein
MWKGKGHSLEIKESIIMYKYYSISCMNKYTNNTEISEFCVYLHVVRAEKKVPYCDYVKYSGTSNYLNVSNCQQPFQPEVVSFYC